MVAVPDGYMTTEQVCARYGDVHRTWITRRQKRDGFPKAIHLGTSTTNRYIPAELDAWDAAVIHRRLNREPPRPLCPSRGREVVRQSGPDFITK